MQLRKGEKIIRIYRHHPTPYIFSVFELLLGLLPFLGLLLWLGNGLSDSAIFWWSLGIGVFFLFMFLHITFVYWLDKLVITNQRIVYVEWTFLTIRREAEAFLHDIQDIQTKENGIFASFNIFDYGTFTLKTAASKVTLVFLDAPDPEGIRNFVYNFKEKYLRT